MHLFRETCLAVSLSSVPSRAVYVIALLSSECKIQLRFQSEKQVNPIRKYVGLQFVSLNAIDLSFRESIFGNSDQK